MRYGGETTDFGVNSSSFRDGYLPSELRTIASKLLNERFKISTILSVDSFSNTITRHRLSKAEFRLKDGFSVVAPIKVIAPLSTWGKNMS